MSEFWEESFQEKQEMWGFEASASTLIAKDFFIRQHINDVLIPGIGYGRNAKVFLDHGMQVSGIEISKTAIQMASKHCGPDLSIHHGSVTDMPFDDRLYKGIFCYAVIHLLDEKERRKLIKDCYQQLAEGGYMYFAAISKMAETYGDGPEVSKDRFKVLGLLSIYFYDEASIRKEFEPFGLDEITLVQENYPFYLVRCKKQKGIKTG